jgi:hypothetical protein
MAADMPNRSKFTVRRQQRILAILAAGGSRRTAAAVAGIDPATLRYWLRRGKRSAPGGRFRRFLEDVQAAEAGQRLVGLPSDDRDEYQEELKWAMWHLERTGWEAQEPEAEEPEGPAIINRHPSGWQPLLDPMREADPEDADG